MDRTDRVHQETAPLVDVVAQALGLKKLARADKQLARQGKSPLPAEL